MRDLLLLALVLGACRTASGPDGTDGRDTGASDDSDDVHDAVDGPEDVDTDRSDTDRDPTDTDIPQADRMLLFVTPNDYTRNFDDLGGTPGDGLAGADALCDAAAAASALGGTYKAWLSTRTVHARDRFDDVGPWYAVGRGIYRTGAMLFRNKAALLGAPLDEINVSSDDSTLRGRVWTATGTGGLYESSDCGEWGANNEYVGDRRATVGDTLDRLRWTDDGSVDCDSRGLLYCFQVAK